MFNLGARRSFDVIAGDFVSSRSGQVTHAAAISVVVSSSRAGMNLEVEDGNRTLSLDFSQQSNDGPQFAQRRIAEAAVMVHMARAFGVDYRPCIAENVATNGTEPPAPPTSKPAPINTAQSVQR
jgi:hypothetical protein